MYRYIAKLLTGLSLLFMLSFTGCAAEQTKGEETPRMTKLQLLEKYDTKETKSAFLPIYNVKQGQCFQLKFNALPEKTDDIITVYRDSIEEGNEVAVKVIRIEKNREQYLTIIPKEKVTDSHTGITKNTWGAGGSYYIRINYDFQSQTPKKLDYPIYVHFTIDSDIGLPDLKYKIDSKGNVLLFWNERELATQYKIYNKMGDELKEIDESIMPEWSLSLSSKNEPFVHTSQFITIQNNNVAGKYFVSAIQNGVESLLSNGLDVGKIGKYIPVTVVDEFFGKQFNSLDELPNTVKVKMLSGDFSEKEVFYDFENVNQNNLSEGFEVNYSIQDTELTGYVKVKSATLQELTGSMTMAAYNRKIKQPFCIAGYVPVENKTKKYAAFQLVETRDEAFIDLYRFKVKTEQNEGNLQEVVPEIPENYICSYSNALEELLVRYLINNKTTIDLSGFPEANNEPFLQNTIEKIVLENPLILGVKSYSFNYRTQELTIEYYDSKGIPWKEKQSELISKVQECLLQLEKSSEDKKMEQLIYDYIVENCPYYYNALKNAKEYGFYCVDDQYVDAFNAYGTLVQQRGAPSGYAAAYKILCDYQGIESNIIVGSYSNTPHVWNFVKSSDQWGYIDVSNNYISCGIPYPVFYTDEDGLPKDYELKKDISSISKPEDLDLSTKDYYEMEGLVFYSEDELTSILKELIENQNQFCVLKNATEDSDKDICTLIAEKIHEMVSEQEFTSFYVGKKDDFIVISKSN